MRASMDVSGFSSTRLRQFKSGTSSGVSLGWVLPLTFRSATASPRGIGSGYLHSYENCPFFWQKCQINSILYFFYCCLSGTGLLQRVIPFPYFFLSWPRPPSVQMLVPCIRQWPEDWVLFMSSC